MDLLQLLNLIKYTNVWFQSEYHLVWPNLKENYLGFVSVCREYTPGPHAFRLTFSFQPPCLEQFSEKNFSPESICQRVKYCDFVAQNEIRVYATQLDVGNAVWQLNNKPSNLLCQP